MNAPANDARIAELHRKLEARAGKAGFRKNARAIRLEIARLQAKGAPQDEANGHGG